MLQTMRQTIETEKNRGNEMFFDITGGENLILVAFGMLAGEYDTPMHQFNVREDSFIELKGGVVNHSLHKDVKAIKNKDFSVDVDRIWQVAKHHWDNWNQFSNFLGKNMVEDYSLQVLNEIDVLTITGNVPTFISCKGGKLGSHQTLHALYEQEKRSKQGQRKR